jgi:hypothetical protein
MPVPTSGRQTSLGSIRGTDSAGLRHIRASKSILSPALDRSTVEPRPLARRIGERSMSGHGSRLLPSFEQPRFRQRKACMCKVSCRGHVSRHRAYDPSLHGNWAGTSAREPQYMRSEEGLGWG